MPTEIDLGTKLPGGHIAEVDEDRDMVAVAFMEFISTEDGQAFVQRLEAFPSEIITKLSADIQPSQVDNMLVIIKRTGKAVVYLNEVSGILRVRPARSVVKGQQLTKDDIADIETLQLHDQNVSKDIEVPDDTGVLYIFSIGWRKGMFYDYGPIVGKEKRSRPYDLTAALGRVYCHVLFQERFSISDEAWDLLFSEKWFPFVGLSNQLIDKLIRHVEAKSDSDELLDEVVTEVKNKVNDMLSSWSRHSSFTPHLEIVERAVERFLADDYISCTSNIVPRIEGILRTYHRSIQPRKGMSPEKLAASAVLDKRDNYQSLVFPHRFERYLRKVYFDHFDQNASEIDVSRHSVAHGEASVSKYGKKSAVISLLILHQLFYTFKHDSDEVNDVDESR